MMTRELGKLNERTKITLTIGQLKRLVSESVGIYDKNNAYKNPEAVWWALAKTFGETKLLKVFSKATGKPATKDSFMKLLRSHNKYLAFNKEKVEKLRELRNMNMDAYEATVHQPMSDEEKTLDAEHLNLVQFELEAEKKFGRRAFNNVLRSITRSDFISRTGSKLAVGQTEHDYNRIRREDNLKEHINMNTRKTMPFTQLRRLVLEEYVHPKDTQNIEDWLEFINKTDKEELAKFLAGHFSFDDTIIKDINLEKEACPVWDGYWEDLGKLAEELGMDKDVLRELIYANGYSKYEEEWEIKMPPEVARAIVNAFKTSEYVGVITIVDDGKTSLDPDEITAFYAKQYPHATRIFDKDGKHYILVCGDEQHD